MVKHLNASALVVISALIMGGCNNLYPIPVSEPPVKDKSGEPTTVDHRRGGLPPARRPEEAVSKLKIYGDWYQTEAERLLSLAYTSSDITLLGGIVGIVGGLVKSAETALAGGAVATGSSIRSQRYKLEVQAQNYEKAADAMYCMYRNLYVDQDTLIPIQYINEKIDEIRSKLRKNQLDVKLASPNLAELESTVAGILAGKQKPAGAPAEDEVQQKRREKDEQLKKELVKCVVTF